MEPTKDCLAMLLAGGEGRRLGVLTQDMAKPAVPFGGKFRIVDFALSNCTHSGIKNVGVLTQYRPQLLNRHIGVGAPWNLDKKSGGVTILPPYIQKSGGKWYRGPADAVYQNLHYIKRLSPSFILVISGDHIYKMDYSRMLRYHREKQADVTVAVHQVPWMETRRIETVSTALGGRGEALKEKPENPGNVLASMGIYLFNRDVLIKHLTMDQQNAVSSHDFGQNVLPQMLHAGSRLYAYLFQGYWKDVGTIKSYWEANMSLLEDRPPLDLHDKGWRIFTVNGNQPPQQIQAEARVSCSLINEGCVVSGQVEGSILFPGVQVGRDSVVRKSIVMAGTRIGAGVVLDQAIVGEKTVLEDGVCVAGEGENILAIRHRSYLSKKFLHDSPFTRGITSLKEK